MVRCRGFSIFLYLSIVLISSQFFVNSVNCLDPLPVREVSCTYAKWLVRGFIPLGMKKFGTVRATFHLSTQYKKDPVMISSSKKTRKQKELWKNLVTSKFNPAFQTTVITHGYLSSKKENWVKDIVNKLHEIRNVNIILVDWSKTAFDANYFQTAKNTPRIAEFTEKFFNDLKVEVAKLPPVENPQWNNLTFIGHSLGAHVSGRTAHLLKQNSFWHIHRITGLDPAKPCFVETSKLYKLDNEDADFVDIIHSQVGTNNHDFSFGLNQPLGDIDFYMDGGRTQPDCLKSSKFYEREICSHTLACKYYAETLTNQTHSACSLYGYRWDGKRDSAVKLLNNGLLAKQTCADCPEVGINSIQSKERGTFLVLTYLPKPECPTHDDLEWVKKAILKLKKGATYN